MTGLSGTIHENRFTELDMDKGTVGPLLRVRDGATVYGLFTGVWVVHFGH